MSLAVGVRFSLRGVTGVAARVLRLGNVVTAARVAACQRKALRFVDGFEQCARSGHTYLSYA